jgi:hypothetical protein
MQIPEKITEIFFKNLSQQKPKEETTESKETLQINQLIHTKHTNN